MLEWSINATTESALGVPRLADLCRTGLHVHKTRREANRCWISDENVCHSNFGPRPLLADSVAKVENRTTPEISQTLTFGRLRRCNAM
jgi:hypothetical protein